MVSFFQSWFFFAYENWANVIKTILICDLIRQVINIINFIKIQCNKYIFEYIEINLLIFFREKQLLNFLSSSFASKGSGSDSLASAISQVTVIKNVSSSSSHKKNLSFHL